MKNQKQRTLPNPNFMTMACMALSMSACAAQTNIDGMSETAKTLVTVNDVAQSAQLADLLVRDQLTKGAVDGPLLRDNIRQILINQALLVEQAKKDGIDKLPMIQAQIELAKRNILAQAWQQKQLSEIVLTEAELKAEYDRQLASLGDKDYLIRHLLVKEEASANLLLKKMEAGASIESLAHEFSIDPASRQQGGLTDWTNISNLLPPIALAVGNLQKGQYANKPIESPLGWHILQLEDVRPFKTFTFEQSKPQLQITLARRALQDRVKSLREKAKVE